MCTASLEFTKLILSSSEGDVMDKVGTVLSTVGSQQFGKIETHIVCIVFVHEQERVGGPVKRGVVSQVPSVVLETDRRDSFELG